MACSSTVAGMELGYNDFWNKYSRNVLDEISNGSQRMISLNSVCCNKPARFSPNPNCGYVPRESSPPNPAATEIAEAPTFTLNKPRVDSYMRLRKRTIRPCAYAVGRIFPPVHIFNSSTP